ncbi:MAG: DUF3479 domain-containing protein, partial [Pseudomonadota bacterium]
MMQKPISAGEPVPIRVVILTLDRHIAGAMERAMGTLRRELPGLTLSLHIAAEWSDEARADAARADIAKGDIVIATMLFMEEHIQAVLPALKARRENCDAMIACVSAGEVMKLTRIGRFRMDGKDKGPIALLKRLRGSKKQGQTSGAKQMKMLRRLPKILRFIPGTAQDVRAYFLCMQYWLASTDDNLANMVKLLVNRYAAGPREVLNGSLRVADPVDYPETGLYHPDLPDRVSDAVAELPVRSSGRVGLLLMRSYVLSGDTGHYDGVIRAFEARGLSVVPAFAGGLDARPAINSFFRDETGSATVDAIVSLTGFSLVGGPAYNDSDAAAEILNGMDVPYIAAQALEFQTLEAWESSDRGLMPVEATMMVAIPELDGATGPMVYGGRQEAGPAVSDACIEGSGAMTAHSERASMLARRVEKLITLARAER